MHACNKNSGRKALRPSGRISNYFMNVSVKDKTGWIGRTLPTGDRKKISLLLGFICRGHGISGRDKE